MFKDQSRFIINAGITIVIILIVVTLIVSLYQIASGDSVTNKANFLQDPEIISVAIGLILSVLFVDRWRSLESKVDSLSTHQQEHLDKIQKFANEQTELKIGQTIDKAEKVSAKLSSISERHPWLDVISERDIIVETESVRGILRTSYSLLREGKYLHLYEYLEYCSRKGTKKDARDDKFALRGTAEDFLEIASFCEVWLEDYALGAEFLTRYIEQMGVNAYVMYPDYIHILLRIGALQTAQKQMYILTKILAREKLYQAWPFIKNPNPISERYRWHAANILSLAYAIIRDYKRSDKYATVARESAYARLFKTQQMLFNAEHLIHLGQFNKAFKILEAVEGPTTSVFDLRDLVLLLEKLGAYEKANLIRKRITDMRILAFGDDGRMAEDGRAPHVPNEGTEVPPQAEGKSDKPEQKQEPSYSHTSHEADSLDKKPETERHR
ncbi:hypothetical protein SAMN02949497_4232 [Methylomagnum ishizawai]|uniref:Uncharacterized protein n=1 Tax=Methylomagnum ishizawai TaxID=1760988 RepID=A0A1Y6D2I3_9GAMM|nr:hypothetical protein [Methylomagnum ishizawai]SMF96821.1 hypothetical protein SAMN02949497_4232 [Methylomagnum ishizawai]